MLNDENAKADPETEVLMSDFNDHNVMIITDVHKRTPIRGWSWYHIRAWVFSSVISPGSPRSFDFTDSFLRVGCTGRVFELILNSGKHQSLELIISPKLFFWSYKEMRDDFRAIYTYYSCWKKKMEEFSELHLGNELRQNNFYDNEMTMYRDHQWNLQVIENWSKAKNNAWRLTKDDFKTMDENKRNEILNHHYPLQECRQMYPMSLQNVETNAGRTRRLWEDHGILYEFNTFRHVSKKSGLESLKEHHIYYKGIYADPASVKGSECVSNLVVSSLTGGELDLRMNSSLTPNEYTIPEDIELYKVMKELDDELEKYDSTNGIYDPYNSSRQCHDKGVVSECSVRPNNIPMSWLLVGTAMITRYVTIIDQPVEAVVDAGILLHHPVAYKSGKKNIRKW